MTTSGEFIVRLVVAFFLGIAIGVERKFSRSTKFLKLTTLISVGTAAYAMAFGRSLAETNFLILGISLICASIILNKETDSLNIDSAILLWCAGIVGSLTGSGSFLLAYSSTLIIAIAKFLFQAEETSDISNVLREEELIESTESGSLSRQSSEESIETLQTTKNYHCQISCHIEDEARVLASMVQCVQEQNIMLTSLQSNNNSSSKVIIDADFTADPDEPIELTKIFQNLKSELKVDSLSWHQIKDK